MQVYNMAGYDLKAFEIVQQQGTITMAVPATLCVCVIAILFQNVSSVYIDPSYDCIAPWARTFLAWRDANTNAVGGLSPLLRYIPPVYSKCHEGIPLSSAGIPSALTPCSFAVTSASKGSIGMSVLSENIVQGPLAVAGELPFLGGVALGGTLPAGGSGSVSTRC